ncbi:AraC family transcriptional regulator [Pelagibacterium luteolum]|uniref:AraC family transcriptional regulator n=1 Tax=Pelagibacterium luteolum TaxID=440168 RepID=A0A1G7UUK1_9HYPH|nr:AraC family transcriptional regulator [Pelagibacterium luteolum]SDG51285.1 AraC family transcriptional regulator [Pelagibacterium luteolum]
MARFVGKVLWYIEGNFRKGVELDDIAAACGVSRFHMCRGFAAATGLPVMEYLRGRRLTEAARELAAGAPRILDVALDAGYGSHEAFTRAFRERFGQTPDAVRDGCAVDPNRFVEPLRMDRVDETAVALDEPRRETGDAMTIIGLARRYGYRDVGGIPAQWTAFQAFEGTLGEDKGVWFGLCDAFDEAEGTFRYTCGVRAAAPHAVPPELEQIKVPAQTYLVFAHKSHISQLRHTMNEIWSRYLPSSPFEADGSAPMFELYDEKFDPHTGLGGIEIWIPIKA